MNKKILTITIPFDKIYEEVQKEFLAKTSYNKQFWYAIVPPHKIVLEFNGISETGVENIKSYFREKYSNSEYKTLCKFQVKDVNDG